MSHGSAQQLPFQWAVMKSKQQTFIGFQAENLLYMNFGRDTKDEDKEGGS